MNVVLLLLSATIFNQADYQPSTAPEMAVVVGLKIRGQQRYFATANVSVSGDQSGQITVDFPAVNLDAMGMSFSVPAETWTGEGRGYLVEFALNGTDYHVTREPLTWMTYPVDGVLHRVYEQIGADRLDWDPPPSINWTVRGPSTTISGTSPLGPATAWTVPGIWYDPDRRTLCPIAGMRYDDIVWSGVLDGLPVDVVTYAHVSHQLVPEPSSLMLAAIGAMFLLLGNRKEVR